MTVSRQRKGKRKLAKILRFWASGICQQSNITRLFFLPAPCQIVLLLQNHKPHEFKKGNYPQEIRHFSPFRLRNLCHITHESFTSKIGNGDFGLMRFAVLAESRVCKEEIQVDEFRETDTALKP